LNLARRKEDVPWMERLVHMSVFEAGRAPGMPEALRTKVAERLATIRSFLATVECVLVRACASYRAIPY
jgi:hypothetical protein